MNNIDTYINKVIQGDNMESLKLLPDNSVDAIVTDPPYGLGKEPDATQVLQSWVTKGYHEISGKGFMGKAWDAFVPQPNFWKEIFRVLKPGGHVLAFAGTRTYDWTVMAVRLAGFEIRDQIIWANGQGFPKGQDVSKALDKKLGVERESLGMVKGAATNNTNSLKKGLNPEYEKTEATSDLAKQWDGWKTNLKPAVEPIVMARKPLKGTLVDNIIEHSVGAINIDGCRVEGEPIQVNVSFEKEIQSEGWGTKRANTELQNQGRFPANLILDDSEEIKTFFPHTKSGKMLPEHNRGTNGSPHGIYGTFDKEHPLTETIGDEGLAARFFYQAKVSPKERNAGMPEGVKNIHPTVKPIDLMQYLIKLVTPPSGIVLDPFAGSGSTLIAAQNLDINFIGMEYEEEYVNIINHRLKHYKNIKESNNG